MFFLIRVCAYDLGSSLDMLRTLRPHASIFKLAASVASLHLKATKLVLVITCVKSDGDAHFAISNSLRAHVCEFAEFTICSSGGYLGWHLGIDSIAKSFEGPLRNFVSRVHGPMEEKAPSIISFCKYDHGLVPVLYFVSQPACPPSEPNLEDWISGLFIRYCDCLPTLCQDFVI